MVVTLRCKQFSNWLTQDVNNSGMGYLLSHVIVYGIGRRIPLSKQYRYVANHLPMYDTN